MTLLLAILICVGALLVVLLFFIWAAIVTSGIEGPSKPRKTKKLFKK